MMNTDSDDADYRAERAERIHEMLSDDELAYLRRRCRELEKTDEATKA